MKTTPFELGKYVKAKYGIIDETYISAFNSGEQDADNLKTSQISGYCEEYPDAKCYINLRSHISWAQYNILSTWLHDDLSSCDLSWIRWNQGHKQI